MNFNLLNSSSDDDFVVEARPIIRPNYDAYVLDIDSSPDARSSFMRRDSDGDLIIEPGQSRNSLPIALDVSILNISS